jgi:hypothetical protein
LSHLGEVEQVVVVAQEPIMGSMLALQQKRFHLQPLAMVAVVELVLSSLYLYPQLLKGDCLNLHTGGYE